MDVNAIQIERVGEKKARTSQREGWRAIESETTKQLREMHSMKCKTSRQDFDVLVTFLSIVENYDIEIAMSIWAPMQIQVFLSVGTI